VYCEILSEILLHFNYSLIYSLLYLFHNITAAIYLRKLVSVAGILILLHEITIQTSDSEDNVLHIFPLNVNNQWFPVASFVYVMYKLIIIHLWDWLQNKTFLYCSDAEFLSILQPYIYMSMMSRRIFVSVVIYPGKWHGIATTYIPWTVTNLHSNVPFWEALTDWPKFLALLGNAVSQWKYSQNRVMWNFDCGDPTEEAWEASCAMYRCSH